MALSRELSRVAKVDQVLSFVDLPALPHSGPAR